MSKEKVVNGSIVCKHQGQSDLVPGSSSSPMRAKTSGGNTGPSGSLFDVFNSLFGPLTSVLTRLRAVEKAVFMDWSSSIDSRSTPLDASPASNRSQRGAFSDRNLFQSASKRSGSGKRSASETSFILWNVGLEWGTTSRSFQNTRTDLQNISLY